MSLPEVNETTEELVDDTSASKVINYFSWIILIGFLILCLSFGYGIGKGIGTALGKEIAEINLTNQKNFDIIP